MTNYPYGNKRSVRRRHILMVLLYGAVLLGVLILGFVLDRDKEEEQPTFGSLEGRFDSEIYKDHDGQKVNYREREITNYLLIGVDQTTLEASDHQNGGQADFLLVLSIDRRHRTITPVMIDRDTVTDVATYGIFGDAAGKKEMQICLAQAFSGRETSGSENTTRAVTDLLGGVKINHYIAMDESGIPLLNDMLGGVSVTLDDDLTALDPALKKGETVTLDGAMAEKFVRGRMTVADGSNASRMERQKVYIKALLRQLETKMEKDSSFMAELLEALDGHVISDAGENTLIGDVTAYQTYDWQPLQMLPGTHEAGEDGFMEFHPDAASMEDMVVEIWFD